MPNGYSWLAVSQFVKHKYDHWVVQTGLATEDGDESRAFREPDETESRLIDVMTTKESRDSSGFVPKYPSGAYHSILFGAAGEGTCRWTEPVNRVIASAWNTEENGIVRFLDGIPVECGVERTSSVLIVLKTTRLYQMQPHQHKRKAARTMKIFEVQLKLALRQVIDTTVTMPKCRAWTGQYSERTLFSGDDEALVREVIQRSLVEGNAYSNPSARAIGEKSTGIWTRALRRNSFLDALD